MTSTATPRSPVRQPYLHAVPGLDRAQELAEWTLKHWGTKEEDWLREGRIETKVADLGGPDGSQALLLPLGHGRDHHFRIVLNQCVKGVKAKRFLIAHEIAHTFFYYQTDAGHTTRTTAIRGLLYSKEKAKELEDWCDHFATHLVGYPVPKEIALDV